MDAFGRGHHPNAFTMWLSGGVKPGLTLGETDEFGFSRTGPRGARAIGAATSAASTNSDDCWCAAGSTPVVRFNPRMNDSTSQRSL